MSFGSASAPGKVLICGGYLVVEAPHVGLSIGVSARFRTTTIESTTLPEGTSATIDIKSPQFDAVFSFRVSWSLTDDVVQVEQVSGRESLFLFYSVLTSFVALRHFGVPNPRNATFVLEADNDFYSQRTYLESIGKAVNTTNLRTVPAFNKLVGDVSKTGLGSSAALTTSLVAAICNTYARDDAYKAHESELLDIEFIHRVAQAAHSVAQGKIGSGFDVHTAVYGTNVYVRFPAARVDALMADKLPTSFSAAQLWACIDPAVEWVPRRPVTLSGLPPRINLMLADIHQGGSATPGMVSKIMSWRKSVAGSPDNLWDQLAVSNVEYLDTIRRLAAFAVDNQSEYAAAIDDFRRVPSASWVASSPAGTLFAEFRDRADRSRTLLRQVGVSAEVEVEPTLLTPLLNATAQLPGVIAVGCPGAGGFDAVFCLVVGGDDEMAKVEQFWESYSELHVCPLLVREASSGLTLVAPSA